MRAVVLVGGFGTRLRPLTLSTPKQMLPLVDRPMIEHVVGALAAGGIDEVVLSLGYRPDAFADAYPDATCAGVRLVYAVEPEPLDTAGAVRFAADAAGIDERFVVCNGDVLTDLDLRALLAQHERTGAEGTIALTPVDDPSRYGVVPIDGDGRVEAFVEKPPPGEAPTNWINAGTYVLEPSVLGRIALGRRVSIERETFPAMVEAGTLFGFHDDAYWIDTGTPDAYLQAGRDLTDGRRATSLPPVSSGADVDPSAKVQRSVVMDGAVVAADATVVDAAILPGARVGAGASVLSSIIGPRAVVGAGATVDGGSVIGDDEHVEAGAALHGARVPEGEGRP